MKCLSSIGKKQVMALTGLALCGFLVAHLTGNLLIFVGPEAFNTYAHTLTSTALIYPAEAVLLAIFLTHIGLAIALVRENRIARGQRYYLKRPTGRGANFASTTMPYTGVIILIFLIFHLLHFKYGTDYRIVHSGVEMRDMYRLLLEYFQSKMNVASYIVAQIVVGIHVSHGFSSAFQSLGFNHPSHTPCLKRAGKIFAIAIAMGFSSLPIYLHLQGGF